MIYKIVSECGTIIEFKKSSDKISFNVFFDDILTGEFDLNKTQLKDLIDSLIIVEDKIEED